MTSARQLSGEPVAAALREAVAERARRLSDQGTTPTLGTVLASDDPADVRFLELKHEAAAELGLRTRDVRVDPASPDGLPAAVRRLGGEDDVDGVFVQAPLPPGADEHAVRGAVPPSKDVDAFHPETLGRLVAGDPRYVPATPAAVLRLLAHYDVPTAGRDVTVVGRSTVIGRPLANLLLRRAEPGNATVTVCHSRTRDLGAKTRAADVVVTAAGRPGLVDGSMLSPGATVVDVSATRTTDGGEVSYVGDVEASSAAEVVEAITPVPGGVGPVTVAALLSNVVLAAERRADGVEPAEGGWLP
ncbi:MAG: bifunctional 5,10-methylenetetrahydrofolate dehydrogenase/5,10-methenyltetrahydrofolate cyclohydrolase [Halobacteriales archaeon]|nr:bifunctional 5,10-methylenetetrahydrofolate dehydrogenase/5,10-methenyltetrahydrofolate cyclohydrolase [Halobacteriales archaeon]